jgi:hypothetical protein
MLKGTGFSVLAPDDLHQIPWTKEGMANYTDALHHVGPLVTALP